MFQWTDEIMAFRADADRINHADRFLARQIAAELMGTEHICDAGCGMGFLSVELAKLGFSVTACDHSEDALRFLENRCREEGIQGIETWKGDLFSAEPKEKYDAMVFCFFGRVEEILQAISKQCKGKAFVIKKDWNTHRFDMKERPLKHSTFQKTCRELTELGLPYETKSFSLEMGQPLCSVEDGVRFFAAYDPDGAVPTQEEVAARLEKREGEFPWFLPSVRPLGMIILNAGDIPDNK